MSRKALVFSSILIWLISAQIAFADTFITKPLNTHGQVRWDVAGSPYHVSSNIWVKPNSKLTIEPGVKVLFYGPHVIQVDGELVALGTPEAKITFTSGKANPAPGDWGGIIFGPSSMGAIISEGWNYGGGGVISHAEISYGGFIYLQGASPFISNNNLHHLAGVPLNDWPLGAIWACNSRAVIRDNTITRNNGSGVVLLGSSATIIGNTIASNLAGRGFGGGIFIGSAQCPAPTDLATGLPQVIANANLINGNFIGYNKADVMGGGLAVYSGDHLIFDNCIRANQTPHIRQTQTGGSAIGCLSNTSLFAYNQIVDNEGAEALFFNLQANSRLLLENNNIVNPLSAFEIVSGKVGENPDIGIYALNNFWGSALPDFIAQRTHDAKDEAGLMEVDSVPFLSSESRIPTACALDPGFSVAPNPVPTPGSGAPISDVDALALRGLTVTPKSLHASGGLVTVRLEIGSSERVSGWITISTKEPVGARKPSKLAKPLKETLRCANNICQGLIKFDRVKFSSQQSKRSRRVRTGRAVLNAYLFRNSQSVRIALGSIKLTEALK